MHTSRTIILKQKRSTETFRGVFERHRNGHAGSYLSRSLYRGTATVEWWFHDFLKRKISESGKDLFSVKNIFLKFDRKDLEY